MPHDGPHHHGHDHAPDDPSFGSRAALGARALRELLEEAGVLAPGEVARQVERMDTITPALGAKVVARAWTDPDFKARLLADGSAAVREFGVEMGTTPLYVVENTESVHNMIVCTLCSCYPKPLLGIPPDWYKSFEYRSRAVREPRAVLAEFGVRLPDGVAVRVHDSTADLRYLVLPRRPEGTEGWDEARLAGLVTRDCMIGTAVPSA
ncbi:nitrile hydratase subunit alpha [Elioraea sp. Yellowstone]|jgi:nitrile hydratase|uniref:nitrile hydratase subunit alpha n=1 Tax=Elioraea sp. Yellowstone TaxID=2592070 RepID=UPI001153556F|nr:nitrile hydratase subunit alpha [Elioraea sp. Yellowstone]TQF83103.1 nitrile hydratase subunit alpha [Elioraea sp. Yellowstone]